MDIKHHTHDRGGEFVIEENGNRRAEIAYTTADDKRLLFDHTFVEQHLRGEGVGKKLVARGVEFARANDFKIVPLCPFVKATMDSTPEFRDVLSD